MEYLELSVPTKPYIKRYMENTYSDPIYLTRRENPGSLLFLLLERSPHENDKRVGAYSVTMKITLSSKFYHRKGAALSPTSLTIFNNFLEENIKNIMQAYIKALMENKVTDKKAKAINTFLEKNSFPPDTFPFETIKKHLYRYEKSIKN